MSEWIYPSDRLPEQNQDVIVCRCCDGDYAKIEQGTYEGVKDWWKVYGTRVKTKSIIAWMPMPDPPEGVIKLW